MLHRSGQGDARLTSASGMIMEDDDSFMADNSTNQMLVFSPYLLLKCLINMNINKLI